jgi:uncharacterized membrane protein
MFEFLFRYPRSVFAKGEFVLLGTAPKWLLLLLILAGAALLAWMLRSRLRRAAAVGVAGWRPALIWALQSTMLAVILILLWQPAVLVSTLKPQQNVVAVVVDNSTSMAASDEGRQRLEHAKSLLKGGVLTDLQKRFQTRLYRLGDIAERIPNVDNLAAQSSSTHLSEGLKQVVFESTGLPLGAVVLLSDGSDNAGGIDYAAISELRNRRIPVHTVGFGREKVEKDLEVTDVQVPSRALPESRVAAYVSLRQTGYSGRRVRLTVRESGKVIASREVTLGKEENLQTEAVLFNVGKAGAKALQISAEGLEGEENAKNNATTRMVNVDPARPRILYFEGEPRWEYKFIRRALEDDKAVQVVSILRTTQNKIFRQGIAEAKELEDGFPAKVEDLFSYQGLILGSVELGSFTVSQQELIKQFVDRRGGGLLMLGSRAGLSEGGYATSGLAEILPVSLPNRKGTFHRDPATVSLTPAGLDSLICRLEEDPAKNSERWKKLPYLADFQEIGTPKPGAAVLAEMNPGSRGQLPFLVTQNYGRGRTAVLAGSTWRWQMSQPLEDMTHEVFWQQLLRWLVNDTPGQVSTTLSKSTLLDEGRVKITAEVRDKSYLPSADVAVQARILGPGGAGGTVAMTPDATNPGIYTADFNADKAGQYLTEVTALRGEQESGRDVVTFQRQDGVAESFHTTQNRDLLEKLATQTGGRYWTAKDLPKLPEEISYSEAGISVRETRDLWNLPVVFLLLLILRGAEWLLRRKWGVV